MAEQRALRDIGSIGDVGCGRGVKTLGGKQVVASSNEVVASPLLLSGSTTGLGVLDPRRRVNKHVTRLVAYGFLGGHTPSVPEN